jgi:branched-chain amino acid transport system ATP-binding protein
MLEIDDLVAAYGPVRALDGVSLAAPEGSITAVLGANGAGKTSLLRTISGLIPARRGRIRFAGRDITGMAAEDIVRLGVAHSPEGGGAIGELTVEDNLRLGALWRSDRGDRAKALRDVYELFPRLAERRAVHASSLSGGERQMLSIGRALMGRPRMLLLDEPSLGLAPIVAAQLMRVIHRLRESSALTVLLVEQNAKSALSIADRGIVLNVGKVAAEEESRALARNDDLRQAYLGF